MKTLLFQLFFYLTISTNAQITFNKTYHAGTDAAFNCIEVFDGYITASMSGFPYYPQHLNFIKIGLWGDTLWNKMYGDSSEYIQIYSLVPYPDSTLMAGCHLYNFVLNKRFVYLLKLKYNGDTIWTRKIPSPSGKYFFSSYLMLTTKNEMLISGQMSDSLLTTGNAFILKTDTNGNYLWHSTFGGLNFDQFYSSIELPDKGFLSLGWTRSFGFGNSGNRDVYLVKTDSLGNFQWQKTYGDSSFETGVGITGTMDGNYLLAGYKEITNIGHAWMIKIDTAGIVIWQRTHNFGVLTDLWWSRELPNGDFIAAGASKNPANQKDDGLIFCTDANGYVKWHRTFPMNNNHAYFRDVRPTSDGGFICAGFCFTGASGNQDAWLVKLDSLGCDSSGCPVLHTGIENHEVSNNAISLQISPNPASQVVLVNLYGARQIDYFDISVYATSGQLVLKKRQLNTGFAQPLSIGSLIAGIYLIRVEMGNESVSKKLLIER